MAFVKVNNQDENGLEKALKLFKKQCIKEGIVEEIKSRQEFISNSVKKQLKRKAIKAKHLRELRKKKKLY